MTDPSTVLAHIAADRACASCGFNLCGQPVTREPHYGLVVARCPECGTLAALQEYPALGTWARRWGALLAALWAVVLLGAFAATAMTAFGFAVGAIEITGEHAADLLAGEYSQWAQRQDAEGNGPMAPSLYFGTTTYAQWDQPDASWPGVADPRAELAPHGGPRGAADATVVWLWIVMGVVAVPFGVFWSLALLHQRPWKAALVPAVAVALASILAAGMVVASSATPRDFADLARRIYAPVVTPVTLTLMLAAVVGACLVARPLARLAVRMALPPRLRVPFGPLWTSAGKPLPRPR